MFDDDDPDAVWHAMMLGVLVGIVFWALIALVLR